MTAAPVTSIALVDGEDNLNDATAPIVLWAGNQAHLTIALAAADGTRMVDQGMTIVPAQPDARLDGWDSFNLTVGAGGASAQVTTGGGGTVLVGLGAIQSEASIQSTDATLLIHNDDGSTTGLNAQTVCVHGHASGAEVVGAPWQFAVAGPAHNIDPDGDHSLFAGNCVDLELDAAGSVTVTGSIGSATASVTFPADPSGHKRQARAIATAPGLTAGERASTNP